MAPHPELMAPQPRTMEADTEHPSLTGAIKAAMPNQPLLNFSPGPAPLPEPVMHDIQRELLNFNGTGASVMSMSHRSPEFQEIFQDTSSVLRRVLEIPDSHEILFCHGGGHGQFAAVPLNLCGAGKDCRADYVVHGTWSRRAAAEAAKYATVRICAESKDDTALPPRAEWDLDPTASYRYICSNETVGGVEFHSMPAFDDGVPLVVDMSSDIASKRIDWSLVGVAFACAPKNIGHAGLTVVVVRRDLLCTRVAQAECPGVLDWRVNLQSGGMWNTPPTFNVYTTSKVLHYIEDAGGILEMERRATAKAGAFYAAIEASDGFYATPVTNRACRSRMNVPFCVMDGDIDATNAFLRAAYDANMVGFRTKTPFGSSKWLRASFYTGTTVEHAEALVAFMTAFAADYLARAAPANVDLSDGAHHLVAPCSPPAEPAKRVKISTPTEASRRHGHADATLEGIRHFGTATKIVVAQPTDRSPLTDYVVRAPVRGCMSTGNLPTFGI